MSSTLIRAGALAARRTDLMSNAVVGGQLWINEQLAIRAEGRDCLTRFQSGVVGEGNTNEHEGDVPVPAEPVGWVPGRDAVRRLARVAKLQRRRNGRMLG